MDVHSICSLNWCSSLELWALPEWVVFCCYSSFKWRVLSQWDRLTLTLLLGSFSRPTFQLPMWPTKDSAVNFGCLVAKGKIKHLLTLYDVAILAPFRDSITAMVKCLGVVMDRCSSDISFSQAAGSSFANQSTSTKPAKKKPLTKSKTPFCHTTSEKTHWRPLRIMLLDSRAHSQPRKSALISIRFLICLI